MSSPSAAELETQLQNAVAPLDNAITTQTLSTDEDTYIQSLESDFAQEQASGMRLFRARAASGLASSQEVLSPWVRAYVHHIVGTPERTDSAGLDRIYQYFVDQNKHVVSRGFTFATPGAFTGTGDGVLKRLTLDENTYSLEAQTPDQKTLICISDYNTGADKHEEVFEFRGASAGLDMANIGGSGLINRNFRAFCSNQSELQNPTFSQYTYAGGTPATSSPVTGQAGDTLTGWTVSDFTATALDVDTYAKDVTGDTTPTSLQLTKACTLTQAFSVAPVVIDPDRPYYLEVWVYRAASADGTLTITWGNKTQAVVVSTLNNAAWNRVVLDMDQDLWPSGFNATTAGISIAYSSWSTGSIYLDEVGLFAMQAFDGGWYMLSGGVTKFLLDDTVTFTDSIASDSKVQKWMVYAFGRYLPHVPAATQITAAGGRTLTFADADPDTITASTGSFVSDGYVVGMKLTVAGTSSNDGTYTLAVVAALVLTLITGDALAAEGPLSATATLNATAHIPDPS